VKKDKSKDQSIERISSLNSGTHGEVQLSRRGGTGAYEEVEDMSLINVSSTRGDYVLVNLEQVAWATIDTNEAGGASRITLHMADGATFVLRDAEAEYALAGLRRDLGESSRDAGLPH
jgi:hypothetical protein